MNSVFKKLIFAISALVILWGCAAKPLPELRWPDPPDIARIKYVKAIYGSANVRESSTLTDIVLGSEGGTRIKKPMGVFVDANGKMYVTDTASSDIFIFDPVNHTSTSLAEMGVSGITKPIGVANDSQGRIFFSDSLSNRVRVVGKDGHLIADLQADEPFKVPTGVAVDNLYKKIYVTDTRHHNVKVFDLDTLKYLRTIGKRGKEDGEFNFPTELTVDAKGYVYVSDTQNGRYQVFDNDGRFIRRVGEFGDAPGMFGRPKGIAVDSEGHVYVADAAFNVIEIFDDEGRYLMAFSGYGVYRGQTILPAGLAIDKNDFIYLSDSWNNRVEIFEYLGDKFKARENAGTESYPPVTVRK